MSRYNAVPLSARLSDARIPVRHRITEFPVDDFEKTIPIASYDLRENLEALLQYHESEEAVDRLFYAIRPRDEHNLFTSESSRQSAGISQGELRFRRIMRIADEIQMAQPPPEQKGIWLQPGQRRGIRADLLATAEFYFGVDWQSNKENFARQWGLKKFYKWRFDVKPRRYGKTIQKCFVAAVLLAAGYPVRCVYYSQSMPTCVASHAKVLDFLEPWLEKFSIGKKQIALRGLQPARIRMARSTVSGEMGVSFAELRFIACKTSGSADRNRGGDVDVVLGDEVAFVSEKILTTDIAVHSSRPWCAVLFCTTPKDDGNVASKLLEAKGFDGDYLFARTYIAGACERCRKNRQEKTCFHVLDAVPDYICSGNALQKAIMTEEEQDQELRALVTVSGQPAFPPEFIDESDESLFGRPREGLPDEVPVAFLGIDPTGFSLTKSDLGVGVVYWNQSKRCVIAGLMSLSTNNIVDMQKGIVKFLRQLRSIEAFRRTLLIPIIERNMKGESQFIANFLPDKFGPYYFPEYGASGAHEGPITNTQAKMDWVVTFQLLITDNLLRLSQPVVTLSGDQKEPDVGEDGKAAFEIFKQQAKAYKFYETPTGKLTANGKEGGKTKDDLFDAVLIAMTNSMAFTQEFNAHRMQLDPVLKKLGLPFYAKG